MLENRSVTRLAAAVIAGLLWLPQCASAQGYPTRQVRMIVPFPAGGGSDGLARLLAERMSGTLGQRVVIENIAGAGGTIGSTSAAKAAPDGYTVMMGNVGTHSVAPLLDRKLAYLPERDFMPIAHFAYLTNYVVAGPSLKAASLAELIRMANLSPGKITFASAGLATPAHLALELFRIRTGVNVLHVPYKGAAPAITDLLGGHVDVIIGDPVTLLPHIAAGKVRALAFAGPRRSAALPDVPTAAEAGVADFHVRAWHGILAPAGVSPEVARKLVEAIQAATRDSATVATLARMGAEPGDEVLDRFAQLIQAERARWGEVITRANIKIE
ncbi:MAG: Bug family tripartite tricarboxylate transporter substrate binding protein [Burkholderiales bacterium]